MIGKRIIGACALAAGTALAMASPVQAKVVKQAADFFVTQDSATVPADPQAVWLALISPGEWWSDEHTWSGDAANMSIIPQGGGCFCERIPESDTDGVVGLAGSVQHMVVLQAFPRKALRMRGGLGPLQSEPATGVLTITIKPVAGGTRILWEYVVGGKTRYDTADIAKAVDGVMSQQLAGLAKKLGGKVDAAGEGAAEERAAPAGKPKPAAQAPDVSSDNVLDAVDALGKKPKD
ncbi:SRPBCC family protein [Erythrobacter sp. LQ02-29]|uniref:SRPBCC family protein n=1 Tax=Erythrobacter sp. LQ02-29 TaxID=2920384 RepID=UPI001F4E0403|nr:SRPBCC family protein [Erythrobacter sp. LQ02-29]